MYMLNEPLTEYRRKWDAFNQVGEFLELTPADRNYAWREWTRDDDWHEWPVPIEWFMHDPYYVGTNTMVRPVIHEFVSDYFAPEHGYEIFVFIGGIGAGKSFSASISCMYVIYQLSCMKNPQKWLNGFPGVSLSGDAEIVVMNASAAGARQAGKIVYGEAFQKIQASPYFKVHFEPYQGKASELEFEHRIRFSPGTSKWESALGWNLFFYVVDEAAFGIESERADYVRELFLAFNQRRKSRFGRLGGGGVFTSPGSEYGFVEVIAGEGETWDTHTLVRRTTTWEAKDELIDGARVFLLDRHPDVVRIIDHDLVYRGEGICQRDNGEIVRYENEEVEDGEEEAGNVLMSSGRSTK